MSLHRLIPSQWRDPVSLRLALVSMAIVSILLAVVGIRGENTRSLVTKLEPRVVRIERGVGQRCVGGSRHACSRLLAALLRDATPIQRSKFAHGTQLIPKGVAPGGGNNNPSGQPGPPSGGSGGGSAPPSLLTVPDPGGVDVPCTSVTGVASVGCP
jgi:hypothetical protein